MECNKFIEEKIGELASPEFRDHLAGCAGCARDVEELREVRTLYRAASTETYPGGVPRVNRFRAGWIPMAAAAAVLMLVFGLILGQPGEKPVPKTESETGTSMFVRVHLEPWSSDAQLTRGFDEVWKQLEVYEAKK